MATAAYSSYSSQQASNGSQRAFYLHPADVKPSRDQGAALEILGHAIEYLIDSRMFLSGIPYTQSETDALRVLARSSRQIFEGAPQILPLRMRVSGWLRNQVGGSRVSSGNVS